MKKTTQQDNRLRILKRVIDRAFAQMVARGKKKAIHKMACVSDLNQQLSDSLDSLFTKISGRPRPPENLGLINQVHSMIIMESLQHLYTSTSCRKEVEKALLADLHKNGVEYELMAQMPLPKRERKPKAQPATPVDMAASKVRQWERKLRMAENKLKKYQRRLKRLQKKGAVAQ